MFFPIVLSIWSISCKLPQINDLVDLEYRTQLTSMDIITLDENTNTVERMELFVKEVILCRYRVYWGQPFFGCGWLLLLLSSNLVSVLGIAQALKV